jgi:hypothetical protein
LSKHIQFIQIPGFATNKNGLDLAPVEAMIFGIIFSFSQDGSSEYCAGRKYLAEATNTSLSTIDRVLSYLVERELIIKTVFEYHGMTFNNYKANMQKINQFLMDSSSIQNEEGCSQIDERGPIQIDEGYSADDEHNITNKEINNKINKETPASPVSAKKNHSMVYKETKTLRDDLESGKEVAVQKKERKKQTELDKCIAEIDSEEYGFSEDLKELLREHLNISFHSKDPKRIKSKGNYQQKLRALKQLISKGNDGIKVVQQSIDRQWNAFYEVKEDYQKKDTRLEGVKAGNESYTKEEIAEMMRTSKVY